jgi:hypothetical protein
MPAKASQLSSKSANPGGRSNHREGPPLGPAPQSLTVRDAPSSLHPPDPAIEGHARYIHSRHPVLGTGSTPVSALATPQDLARSRNEIRQRGARRSLRGTRAKHGMTSSLLSPPAAARLSSVSSRRTLWGAPPCWGTRAEGSVSDCWRYQRCQTSRPVSGNRASGNQSPALPAGCIPRSTSEVDARRDGGGNGSKRGPTPVERGGAARPHRIFYS